MNLEVVYLRKRTHSIDYVHRREKGASCKVLPQITKIQKSRKGICEEHKNEHGARLWNRDGLNVRQEPCLITHPHFSMSLLTVCLTSRPRPLSPWRESKEMGLTSKSSLHRNVPEDFCSASTTKQEISRCRQFAKRLKSTIHHPSAPTPPHRGISCTVRSN